MTSRTATAVSGRKIIVIKDNVFMAELSFLVSSAIWRLIPLSRCCIRVYNFGNQHEFGTGTRALHTTCIWTSSLASNRSR